MTETVQPTLDIPFSEAFDGLNGFEVIAIETHFGKDVSELGPVRLTMGVIWAYQSRGGTKADWKTIKSMTLKEINGYFAPEPPDPESDAGKD